MPIASLYSSSEISLKVLLLIPIICQGQFVRALIRCSLESLGTQTFSSILQLSDTDTQAGKRYLSSLFTHALSVNVPRRGFFEMLNSFYTRICRLHVMVLSPESPVTVGRRWSTTRRNYLSPTLQRGRSLLRSSFSARYIFSRGCASIILTPGTFESQRHCWSVSEIESRRQKWIGGTTIFLAPRRRRSHLLNTRHGVEGGNHGELEKENQRKPQLWKYSNVSPLTNDAIYSLVNNKKTLGDPFVLKNLREKKNSQVFLMTVYTVQTLSIEIDRRGFTLVEASGKDQRSHYFWHGLTLTVNRR